MVKLNTEIFIKKVSKIHNNFYNYSRFVYVNSHTKGEIICPFHGSFFQLSYIHLQKHGCPKCAIIGKYQHIPKTVEEFIEEVRKIHGDKYDYSKFIYINALIKGQIICKIHGSFFQTPSNHINLHGCPKCGIIKTLQKTSKKIEKFISEAKIIHNDFYDYSKFIYINSYLKGIIICPIHGNFLQIPHDHLDGHGCWKCNSSKGELKIMKFLEGNKINYIPQKTFDDCRSPKTNRKLRFDFYIPLKNILIEYDGQQHFISGCRVGKYKTTKKDLENIIYRDSIKTKYAINNKIKLLRIKYNKIKKIDKILHKVLL